MKRVLALIFVVVLLLTSCSSNKYESLVVYEVGGYDYVSVSSHEQEIDLSSETKVNLIKKERVFNIFGREFSTKYTESITYYWYGSTIDFYEDLGETGVLFGVDHKSGDIVKYAFVDEEYWSDTSLTEKSKDECVDIAKSYLGTYVDDVDDYVLEKDSYKTSKKYADEYLLKFVKYKDGMKTCDTATILITVHGKIISFDFQAIGIMDSAKLPNEETLTEVRVKIDERLDAIYKDLPEKYTSVTYGEKEEIFVRMKDGRYALEYLVDVELVSSESEMNFIECNHFIVYLD